MSLAQLGVGEGGGVERKLKVVDVMTLEMILGISDRYVVARYVKASVKLTESEIGYIIYKLFQF